MPVGYDVALRIHDDAGTERTLADSSAVSTLASEKAVKEVVKLIPIIAVGRVTAPPRAHILDGRLSIDVDDARLQLLGNLRELAGELGGRWYRQRSRIRGFLAFLPLYSVRNHSPDQDPDCQ